MNDKSLFFSTALALILLIAQPGAAGAADIGGFHPKIDGAVSFELQDDWAYDSDDPDAEVNALYTKIEPVIALHLTDRLSINTHLTLEPVQDNDPGDDTAFENEGLYIEELTIKYEDERFSVFAGKFDPLFGIAWDLTPGVYGTDLDEAYQLVEKIGVGGSYTLGNEEAGAYTLTAATYFSDTTLSDSTITRRGRLDIDDGGSGNTEDLSSYVAQVDAKAPAGLKGLGAHAGYYNQAEGDADTGLNNEKAYTLSVDYSWDIAENLSAMALAEWTGIRDAAGADDDIDYATLGGSLVIYKNWNAALSYTGRRTDQGASGAIDDYQAQGSAGYTFDNGISFDVGYKKSRESDIDTNTVGALLSYEYEF